MDYASLSPTHDEPLPAIRVYQRYEPRVTIGVEVAQVMLQPLPRFRAEQRETSLEVEFVLGEAVPRLVKQLHLDSYARDAIVAYE